MEEHNNCRCFLTGHDRCSPTGLLKLMSYGVTSTVTTSQHSLTPKADFGASILHHIHSFIKTSNEGRSFWRHSFSLVLQIWRIYTKHFWNSSGDHVDVHSWHWEHTLWLKLHVHISFHLSLICMRKTKIKTKNLLLPNDWQPGLIIFLVSRTISVKFSPSQEHSVLHSSYLLASLGYQRHFSQELPPLFECEGSFQKSEPGQLTTETLCENPCRATDKQL